MDPDFSIAFVAALQPRGESLTSLVMSRSVLVFHQHARLQVGQSLLDHSSKVLDSRLILREVFHHRQKVSALFVGHASVRLANVEKVIDHLDLQELWPIVTGY